MKLFMQLATKRWFWVVSGIAAFAVGFTWEYTR